MFEGSANGDKSVEIGERLTYLPSEALKVYIALAERAQSDARIGLTLNELSRMTGLGTKIVDSMIAILIMDKIIVGNDKGDVLIVDGIKIPYSKKNTDDTRIAVLEEEVRRLSKSRTEKSGLENFYKGSEVGDLIAEIESRGYALTVSEAFLLGQSIQKFGPKRVRATYRQMRRAKNPLPAVWASLQNGIRGQGAQQHDSVPFTEVKTRYLND
jgi:hypothetical protein